jgi:hypothetical protein
MHDETIISILTIINFKKLRWLSNWQNGRNALANVIVNALQKSTRHFNNERENLIYNRNSWPRDINSFYLAFQSFKLSGDPPSDAMDANLKFLAATMLVPVAR